MEPVEAAVLSCPQQSEMGDVGGRDTGDGFVG